jgi:VanZ family protein
VTVLRVAAAILGRLARWWLATPGWLRWSAVVAIMAVLWWSSSRRPVPGEPSVFGELVHNAMHVVAFGALATAAWFACGARRAARAVSIAIAVVYGCVDEYHQSLVPGRTCSIADVMSDTCGAIVAVWALHTWISARRPSPYEAVVLVLASATSVVLATFG